MVQDALSQPAVFIVAAIALLASSCRQQQLTVAEAVKNIHSLSGRTVTVGGYLGECSGYECVLYADAAHEKRTEDWFRRLNQAAQRHERFADRADPLDGALGIGAGKWVCDKGSPNQCHSEFDEQAAPFLHSYVLITGKITDECRDEQGHGGCTDRSTDLQPTSIRLWNRRG
jgi:hypothetical protein